MYCYISSVYTTSRSDFSLLPYGHSRIKLNTDFDSIHTFNQDPRKPPPPPGSAHEYAMTVRRCFKAAY